MEVGVFGEFRIYNPLLPALLEAAWLDPLDIHSCYRSKLPASSHAHPENHLLKGCEDRPITQATCKLSKLLWPSHILPLQKHLFVMLIPDMSQEKYDMSSGMKEKRVIPGRLSEKSSNCLWQSHQLPESMRQNQRPLCITVRARKYSVRLQCPRKRRNAVNVLSAFAGCASRTAVGLSSSAWCDEPCGLQPHLWWLTRCLAGAAIPPQLLVPLTGATKWNLKLICKELCKKICQMGTAEKRKIKKKLKKRKAKAGTLLHFLF